MPALRDRRRNEKEQLLSIFDQTYAQPNKKIMLVHESQIPEKFRPILRRLQAALSQHEVGNMMNVEDDFLAEMQAYEEREMMSAYALEMAQRAQETAQREKEIAIRLLLQAGISKQEIAQKLGLSAEQINRIADTQE